jgi:hypothetical protein
MGMDPIDPDAIVGDLPDLSDMTFAELLEHRDDPLIVAASRRLLREIEQRRQTEPGDPGGCQSC